MMNTLQTLMETGGGQILSAYLSNGCPDAASDVVLSIVSIGEDRLLEILHILGGEISRRPPDRMTRQAVNNLLSEDDIIPTGLYLTAIRISHESLVVAEGDWIGGERFHGRMLHGPEIPLARSDLLLAEATLYRLQELISQWLSVSIERDALEVVAFMECFGTTPCAPSIKEVMAGFGFRKGRLDAISAMMKSILAVQGRYRKVPSRARTHLDISRPSTRERLMSNENPLGDYFVKTEFSDDVSDDSFKSICQGFRQLIDSELVPFGPEENIAVRFRSPRHNGWNGFYNPTFRTMVIRPSSIGSFVHEMGHAVDYVMGHASRNDRFALVIIFYTEAMKKSTECYDHEYFYRPEEIFARTFELYTYSVLGNSCPLMDKRPGMTGYPDDDILMKVLKVFFDGLLCRHRDNGSGIWNLVPRT